MIGLPLPLEKKKEGNVPQTICFKMRQEWFCSFQRQRQAPVHNDVSVMGWQIDWKTMTLAWETHQWAAAQLWSQRALRHTFWTSFVLQLYEPTNEDTPGFQAKQYTISFQRTHDLMTEEDPFLHYANPPSLVLLVKKNLHQGWIGKRGTSLCFKYMTWQYLELKDTEVSWIEPLPYSAKIWPTAQ